MSDTLRQLREALSGARSVAALTGAGISAESGVPTFRGAGGLWKNYDPQQLATPEAFARDPRLVWEWYDWRRGLIAKAEPNAGHRSLVELERRISERGSFTLITQNVDGLHDRSGSRNIVKLHGDIWILRCVVCGEEIQNEQVPLPEIPPRCKCGALMRPGVVWFGEGLPQDEWSRAEEASRHARVFMVIGTSAVVYPAAGLAAIARDAGAKLAVINPESTPVDSYADFVLPGKAGEILPRLL
ncbi:MAG: NAD-dependent deacetylase [Terriglobia bacterium]